MKKLDLDFHRTAVDRFLAILSALHSQHKEEFRQVLSLGGRRRTYFATSSQEIESSGSSTKPQRVPGTPIWVVTNNDTPKKQRIIEGAMQLLRYDHNEARQVAHLVNPDAKLPAASTRLGAWRDVEKSEGDLRI